MISNPLKLCNWLVDHPHILKLANQMLEVNNSFSESSSSLPSSSSSEIADVSIKSFKLT